MAYAIVSPLVTAILRNLNTLVVDEVGIAWGMTTELRNLQSTLTTIQAVLRDAESRQRKSEAVEDWLKKLKDAAYDADNVLEEFSTESLRRRLDIERGLRSQVSAFLSLRNPSIFRYKLGHRLKNVREKLDAIAGERSKFHLNEGVNDVNTNEMERGQTSSLVTESEIYGRHEEKEKIIENLLNHWTGVHDDLSVYAICGMGGLGKTTLAQLVYNDQKVHEHFELKIWVCVSDDFGILRLTREIIEFIEEDGPCNIQNLEILQHRLQGKLRGKRFLLVLDDVWNENHENWDRLKAALKCGAKGSTVIVTTRSQDVVRVMSPHPPHDIEFLSEGDAWSLFKHRAFEVGWRDENLQLEKIGKHIVRKCRGVPLAIKALGDLLRFRSKESEWISVRDNEIWDLRDDGRRILPALKVSYENLAPHLRQCFAYCCIFPKDFEMKKDVLILLWMANGFIPSRARMDLYELGDEIFNDLVSRSFFQDVKVNEGFGGDVTCKMHDLMHDLARSIVRHECCFLTKHSEISEKIRHLCAGNVLLLTSRWKEDLHEVRSLRSFILLGHGYYYPEDVIFTMFSKQKFLRVLVCRLYNRQLPTSISHLKHLRYLDFSKSNIRTLPESTTCLQNLQILKLRNCSDLRELPRGMKYMRNLRYVDIRGCNSLIRTPSGLGSLTCLQTLSIFIVGQKSGHNIGELKRLELQGELSIKKLGKVRNSVEATSANLSEKSNLVYLNLIWSQSKNIPDHAEEVLDGLRPHPNLKKLGIMSYRGSRFPDWLMGLQNVVEVTLADCDRCVHLPPLGKLSSLEVLSLSGMHSVKYFNEECFEDGQNSFPALKILKMKNMRNLEKWTTSGAGQRFSSLLDLKIEGCCKLKEWPLLPTINRLELISSSNTLPRSLTNLVSLTSLSMYDFPNLSVLSGFENLNSLNTLLIRGFDSLISLPENELRGLSSLRKLDIGYCKQLESLSEGVRYITALQSLIIRYCPEIKSLPEGMQQLTALQTLHIYNCEWLFSLPSWVGSLPSLVELKICFCQNMTSLPNGLLNTSGTLKYLEIIACPGLSEWCIRLAEDTSHSWRVGLRSNGVLAKRV